MAVLPESLARAGRDATGSFLAEVPPHLIAEKDPDLFLKPGEFPRGDFLRVRSNRFIELLQLELLWEVSVDGTQEQMTQTSAEQPRATESDLQVVETHVSRLFFVEERVYKSKKPVVNAFLDYSTAEKRQVACCREVELNSRLAPDSYLGVLDLSLNGSEVDHVVVMERHPSASRLSARLDDPGVAADLQEVARKILVLHQSSPRSDEIDNAASPRAVNRLLIEGFEQLRQFSTSVLDRIELNWVEFLALHYLEGRRVLFDERVAQGHARDGHGDLQADDIFCLEDGPRILDCLEFDDQLRYSDELSDVAFLAMDLERLGHANLALTFLGFYQDLGARSWPKSLEHFYIAYRALIRSKVACMRFHQGEDTAAARAQGLLMLAADHLDAASVRLVLVGGLPGTGKTSIASKIAAETGSELLSSDRIRDELFPRSSSSGSTSFGHGRYSQDRVRAVYTEMLRRAELMLAGGQHVVLDASWSSESDRKAAESLAVDYCSFFTELRCVCPTEIAHQRIEHRAEEGVDASEATAEIADGLAAHADLWPTSTLIDTHTFSQSEAAAQAVQAVTNRLKDS